MSHHSIQLLHRSAVSHVPLVASRPLQTCARQSCSHRRQFHSSAQRSALFGSKLFRGLFRRKRAGESDPFAPPRLSLLNQTSLPEDLRLPRPADPLHRIAAGATDMLLSGIGGAVAGAVTYYATGGVLDLSAAAAQGCALVLWVVRDGLGDEGNRSLGKKLFKLEIVQKDGTLASSQAALTRNAYFLMLPALGLHPYLSMSFEVLMFWDVATLFLTPDARKAGDYALGTRVVDERPDRAGRVQDMEVVAEVQALREKVEKAAPGLLAARERADPGLAWYENTQVIMASLATLPGAAAARRAAAQAAPVAPAAAAAGGSKLDLLSPLRGAKDTGPARKSLYDTAPLANAKPAAVGPGGVPFGAGGLFAEIRDFSGSFASGSATEAGSGVQAAVAEPAPGAVDAKSSKGAAGGTITVGGRTLYSQKPVPPKKA